MKRVLVLAALLMAGCGGNVKLPSVNVDIANLPWVPLISRSWTMPATSEGYYCVRIKVSQDIYLQGFRPLMPAGSTEAILTVSDSSTTVGEYACTSGSLDNTGVYAAQTGTGDFTLPEGTAVHVKAGQYLNLNLHIVNNTAAPITGTSGVSVKLNPSTVPTEAQFAYAGTFLINIPSDGQTHTATSLCHTPAVFNLLGVIPKMRSTGTHIKFQSTTGTPQTFIDSDFDVNNQTVTSFTSPIYVDQNTTLVTTCSYNNTTGTTKSYGEADTNEECFVGMYFSPMVSSETLFHSVQ